MIDDRFVVTRGGTPSEEEAAALALALARTTADDARPCAQPPAWTRAALQEGVGGPIVTAPADLEVQHGGTVDAR